MTRAFHARCIETFADHSPWTKPRIFSGFLPYAFVGNNLKRSSIFPVSPINGIERGEIGFDCPERFHACVTENIRTGIPDSGYIPPIDNHPMPRRCKPLRRRKPDTIGATGYAECLLFHADCDVPPFNRTLVIQKNSVLQKLESRLAAMMISLTTGRD
jgi:hypothetical protein